MRNLGLCNFLVDLVHIYSVHILTRYTMLDVSMLHVFGIRDGHVTYGYTLYRRTHTD